MTRMSRRLAVVCGAILLLAAGRASAQLRVGGSAGIAEAFGNTYLSVGGHLGYELPLGVEPNVELQWWLGDTPSVLKLAPGLTWYLPVPVVRPYVGVFYAHWFVASRFSDEDTLGVRGGILLVSAGPAAVGLGVAYEHALSCSVNCDSWTPEVSFTVTF